MTGFKISIAFDSPCKLGLELMLFARIAGNDP